MCNSSPGYDAKKSGDGNGVRSSCIFISEPKWSGISVACTVDMVYR